MPPFSQPLYFIISGNVIGGHEIQAVRLAIAISSYREVHLCYSHPDHATFLQGFDTSSFASINFLFKYRSGNIILQYLNGYFAKPCISIPLHLPVIVSAGTVEASVAIRSILSSHQKLYLYLPFVYDRKVSWPPPFAQAYNQLLKAQLQAFSGIITISQYNLDAISAFAPSMKRHLHIIPNEVTKVERLSSSRPCVLVFIGRLDAQKRILQLIKWISQASFQGIDQFWIIGDGPQRSRAEFLALSSKSIQIKFFGWLTHDQQQLLLSRNDILLVNSLIEGEPLVILEALSRGMRVLARDIPSIRCLLPGSLLFRDKKSLQKKILSALSTEPQSETFFLHSALDHHACLGELLKVLSNS